MNSLKLNSNEVALEHIRKQSQWYPDDVLGNRRQQHLFIL